MAKHPHRLMLNQKKTWRCTLPGCRYFIHLGLAHTLPGQISICWGCSAEFTLSEMALEDDQPMCDNCRMREKGGPSADVLSNYIERKLTLSKHGVKDESELTEMQRNTLKALGKLPDIPDHMKEVVKEDKPEVDEG